MRFPRHLEVTIPCEDVLGDRSSSLHCLNVHELLISQTEPPDQLVNNCLREESWALAFFWRTVLALVYQCLQV